MPVLLTQIIPRKHFKRVFCLLVLCVVAYVVLVVHPQLNSLFCFTIKRRKKETGLKVLTFKEIVQAVEQTNNIEREKKISYHLLKEERSNSAHQILWTLANNENRMTWRIVNKTPTMFPNYHFFGKKFIKRFINRPVSKIKCFHDDILKRINKSEYWHFLFVYKAYNRLPILPLCGVQHSFLKYGVQEEIFTIIVAFRNGYYMEDQQLVNNLRTKRVQAANKTVPFETHNVQHTKLDSVLWNLTGNKGVFVEIGAGDGLRRSRTAWLENAKNWTGSLVEADPVLRRSLSSSGRSAEIYPTCVGLRKYSYKGLLGWFPDFGSQLLDEEWAVFEQIVDVLCYPLYTYILAAGYASVDLISLDINGNEIRVLKTIPWRKIHINVVLVRCTTAEHKEEIVQYLTNLSAIGYEFTHDIMNNFNNTYLIFCKKQDN